MFLHSQNFYLASPQMSHALKKSKDIAIQKAFIAVNVEKLQNTTGLKIDLLIHALIVAVIFSLLLGRFLKNPQLH